MQQQQQQQHLHLQHQQQHQQLLIPPQLEPPFQQQTSNQEREAHPALIMLCRPDFYSMLHTNQVIKNLFLFLFVACVFKTKN